MVVIHSHITLQTEKRFNSFLKVGLSSKFVEVPYFDRTRLLEAPKRLHLGRYQSRSPLIGVLGGDVVSNRTGFVQDEAVVILGAR